MTAEFPSKEIRFNPGLYRWAAVVLTTTVLLGAGLRLHNLGGQGLWLNEMYSLLISSGKSTHYLGHESQGEIIDVRAMKEELVDHRMFDPVAVIRDTAHFEPSHPPLYYVVLNFFLALFGPANESALRLPSVFFGTLTIPFVFLLGRRLYGTEGGLVAAGFFAFSPFQVYYGQEVRMYSMLLFLAVVSVWLLVELSFRRKEDGDWSDRRLWGVLVLLNTAGVYTHYTFAFILAIQFLFLAARHFRDRAFQKYWLIAIGAMVLAYLPWIFARFFQSAPPHSGFGWMFKGHPTWAELIQSLAREVLGFVWVADLRPYKMLWVWSMLLILGAWGVRRRSGLWLLPVWLVVPPLSVLLIDITMGTHASFLPRYYLLSSPALFLLLALGVVNIRPALLSRIVGGVMMIYLVVGAYWTGEGRIFQRDNVKQAGLDITQRCGPDDLVVVVTPAADHTALLLAYYLNRPDRLIRILATDSKKIDFEPVARQAAPSDHVTVVVDNVDHPETFGPESLVKNFPGLAFVEKQRYQNWLYVFRYQKMEAH